MKQLITSDITTAIALPIKKGTLDHLQSAYTEICASVAKAIIEAFGTQYSSGNYYILYGCENSGTGSNYIISEGAIFYNGYVYLVDAATFTVAGGETAVGSIDSSFYTADEADPVTFTDGVQRNVHQISKIIFASGTSGVGTPAFSDMIRVSPRWQKITSTTGEYINPASGSITDRNIYLVKTGRIVTVSFEFYLTMQTNGTFEFTSANLPFPIASNRSYNSVAFVEKPYTVVIPSPPDPAVFYAVAGVSINSSGQIYIYMANSSPLGYTPPQDIRIYGQISYESSY